MNFHPRRPFYVLNPEKAMSKQTVLYATHQTMGARLVPFGGWDMPLHYGSQLEEHRQVRRDAGMFDVSHMTVVDIKGEEVKSFLRHLLANDVDKLKQQGKALYACMLNEAGGVVDDLIVYYLNERWYRLVVNAGTTEKDLAWLQQRSENYDLTITPRRDLAMIAVQGPNARSKALPLMSEVLQQSGADLKPFNAVADGDWFLARTGYTGEDGFEIMLPGDQAVTFWCRLRDAGVEPCGLGARDTLRLEAGMNLYGSDMDDETSPLESGLGWTIAWEPPDRDFVGRSVLERQRNDPKRRRFVGLLLTGRGVLRNHLKLYDGDRDVGEITSGGFAPTLERSIAFARVVSDIGETCDVEMRGKRVRAQVVKPPFVRNGKAVIDI
jgi:aminomethyltransferase